MLYPVVNTREGDGRNSGLIHPICVTNSQIAKKAINEIAEMNFVEEKVNFHSFFFFDVLLIFTDS